MLVALCKQYILYPLKFPRRRRHIRFSSSATLLADTVTVMSSSRVKSSGGQGKDVPKIYQTRKSSKWENRASISTR